MRTKQLLFTALVLTSLTGCSSSFNLVGKLNMVSNRNVDPNLNYKLLTTYSGGSEKELKKTKAESIEDATDQTVKKIPGGEFIMNAKVYLVDGKYFAVEGDVWGTPSANAGYRGFKIGDQITWKKTKKFYKGKIAALKDANSCLVENEEGETVELKYDDITKIQ